MLNNVFFVGFVLLIASSCQDVPSNVQAKRETLTPLPKIDGFSIFKRNMSYDDVKRVLTLNKINYSQVDLTKAEELNYPVGWRYIVNAGDLIGLSQVKIIQGYELHILDKNIDRFQVGFYNDTIFYFNYERNLTAEYRPNSSDQGDYRFTEEAYEDLGILKTLSEALAEKYGPPQEMEGRLNAFYPTTLPFFRWNNGSSHGTQYIERQIWIGNDSSTHILLLNSCSKDTLNFDPHTIKTEGFTRIEVLLNGKYTMAIKEFTLAKENRKRHETMLKMDSLEKERRRQIDSL